MAHRALRWVVLMTSFLPSNMHRVHRGMSTWFSVYDLFVLSFIESYHQIMEDNLEKIVIAYLGEGSVGYH